MNHIDLKMEDAVEVKGEVPNEKELVPYKDNNEEVLPLAIQKDNEKGSLDQSVVIRE